MILLARLFSALILVVATSLPASAGMMGHQVRVTLSGTGYVQVATVGAGIEFQDRNVLMDLTDTQIFIGTTTPGSFSSFGSLYGTYSFFDIGNAIDPILGVTINPATVSNFFDASDVSFNANTVSANMSGIWLPIGCCIVLDVNFTPPPPLVAAPVPPTALLFVAGLGAFAALRRRAR